ncbi:molybdopterin biosynthesis protein MoeA [Desulfocucumis palustris]|uniref:Molybdopterin molybdenumtransferase n=1 Tax=Desulfocucumis palustris TaxID=1898651 RepID=A0A2L2XEQ8_9FIRM|nr:gephyrin-like molybdotransferase Glp [Desulfocucumis palustris]GBF34650.1 molybdopterin biosynthesis protein MoeA [Desulfocucumis palustris]
MNRPVLTSLAQTEPGKGSWNKMGGQVSGAYPMVGINNVEEELLKTPGGPEKPFININIPKDYYAIPANGWRRNLSLEQARALLLRHVFIRPGERLPLLEALGRAIREDLTVQEDIPGFNRSLVDGYALQGRDTEKAGENAPVRLRVLEEVAAGSNPHFQVSTRTAVKVMTGAPLPAGADAVVKYEEVRREGAEVLVYRRVPAGTGIGKAGQELTAGETVVSRGSPVTPSLLGLLAAAGFKDLPVYSAVKAAIISTGSELAGLGQTLGAGRIYNSNQYFLTALLRMSGVEPVPLGIVPDDAAKIAALVQTALERADLVITTGGVSSGDYDLVEAALALAGVESLFSGISVRPGKSFVAGKKDGKLILGLSGHPGAAFAAFEFLVKPVLKKMMGYKNILPRKIEVILSHDYRKTEARRMKAARLSIEEGIARATILNGQGVLKTLADCNLFVDIPPGKGLLRAGEKISAYAVELFDMK